MHKLDEAIDVDTLLMISTKDYSLLPDRKSLETICTAISVLDAIISPEWEYRYYSFNSKWDFNERCLQMRNGSGDEMHILFRDDGCIINGFAHEYPRREKAKLTKGLPGIFNEFIFGEPVNSTGTTFCLWSAETDCWRVVDIEDFNDNSEKMLTILGGQAQLYIEFAAEYFEGLYVKTGISLSTVMKIYNGEPLTRKMVLSIVEEFSDWKKLEGDLNEIGYPFSFHEQ